MTKTVRPAENGSGPLQGPCEPLKTLQTVQNRSSCTSRITALPYTTCHETGRLMETCKRHTGQPRSGVRSVRLCHHSATRTRKAQMHRQQTTDNTSHTRGTPTVGVRPLPSATSPRGDERDMDQAAIGRGSNKQQGSTKHKGRGKSEHTDRDLSLGHMRVRHHTSCIVCEDKRPTAVNTTCGQCCHVSGNSRPHLALSRKKCAESSLRA
eukprot:scaffold3751_cov117-Isochrysis_galbana.AAC.5